MISFDNTEIAFKSKSNRDLKKAYWLFKMVGSPSFVKFGKWATNLSLKIHLPIEGAVKRTIFHQFCGGETIDECDPAIELLHQYGIGTILDYSVEGKITDAEFEHTTNEIIATIEKAKNNPAIPFAVFKITGITRFGLLENVNDPAYSLTDTEKREFHQLLERVDKICKKGFENNVPVFVDAEESWIQDAIDRLAVAMMAKYNKEHAIVYNTVQMYRHDRLTYLHECVHNAEKGNYYYGIKLVRGAYMEKERARAKEKGYLSPIQPNKAASDRDYDAALTYILQNLHVLALCAGTHNEESSEFLAQKLAEFNIDKSDKRIYFAQLLGMSDHISYNLSDAGYNVAKYVPYGPIKEVMPYLLRRADENTSVAGQTGRELSLITKEMKRRSIK